MTTRYRFFLRNDCGELISKHDNSPWTVGEWRETTGDGELCGPGWLHCYDAPELAELHDPIHGQYGPKAELWRVECNGREARDDAMKCGWTRMRPVERAERAIPTTEQRVRYAILCVLRVLPDEPWSAKWRRWADDWLSGRDRTGAAAAAAAATMRAAATRAADAAEAAWAADAARAADAAEAAAVAAASAAELDLAAIARQAMEAQA